MKKKYFVLELKKSIEVFKKNFLMFILTALVLTAAFAAVNFLISKKMVTQPLRVAAVINEDDSMTKMIMRYISQEESIKNISEFEYCSQSDAFDKLYNEEVNVVISFKEDFFEDVNNGTNTPLTVYIRNDSDLITKVFTGMLYSAQGYVQNTEAAVYSFLKLIRDDGSAINDLDMNVGDYLALQYGKLILHRQKIFDNNIISPYGYTNAYEYYFTCIEVLFIIYIVISFSPMYETSDESFGKVIRIYGLNSLNQSLIKQTVIIIPVMIIAVFTFIVKVIAFRVLDVNVSDGYLYMLGLLVTVVGIVSFFNMVFTFGGRKGITGIFALLLLFVMFISSGMLLPYSFLPHFFEYLGKLSPLYYSNNIMFGNKPIFSLFISLLFIILENIMVIKWEKH